MQQRDNGNRLRRWFVLIHLCQERFGGGRRRRCGGRCETLFRGLRRACRVLRLGRYSLWFARSSGTGLGIRVRFRRCCLVRRENRSCRGMRWNQIFAGRGERFRRGWRGRYPFLWFRRGGRGVFGFRCWWCGGGG